MPVLIRDTPLGRELYEQGRQDGWRQGWREGWRECWQESDRQTALRLTTLILRQRFGSDDPRLDDIAARLAALSDEGRISLLITATSLDELQS